MRPGIRFLLSQSRWKLIGSNKGRAPLITGLARVKGRNKGGKKRGLSVLESFKNHRSKKYICVCARVYVRTRAHTRTDKGEKKSKNCYFKKFMRKRLGGALDVHSGTTALFFDYAEPTFDEFWRDFLLGKI